MNLTLQSKISANKKIMATTIDTETVMFKIENGKYYGLDSIGTEIWELIQSPITIKNIIDKLIEEYEVSREKCQNDVFEYLEALYDHQLIEIHG